MEKLYRQLRPWLLATDITFSAYWFVSALVVLNLVEIPPEYLFNDYNNNLVFAWNWSFFPLDMLFMASGFLTIRLHRRNDPRWFGSAFISVILTFCAGFMAVSYWTILLEFDPSWWIPNMLLVIWPLFFLPKFLKLIATSEAREVHRP